METYNFWADLLDTFQSSPDWIKALWLLIPPAFALGLVAVAIKYRLTAERVKQSGEGKLLRLFAKVAT